MHVPGLYRGGILTRMLIARRIGSCMNGKEGRASVMRASVLKASVTRANVLKASVMRARVIVAAVVASLACTYSIAWAHQDESDAQHNLPKRLRDQFRGANRERLSTVGDDPVHSKEPSMDAFPFSYSVDRLDNGLTVVTIPYDSPGLIAYGTLVRVGSRNEVWPGRTGFAHFFEHMMFRGTDKYPPEKYEATLADLGSDHNAFTSADLTFYHLVAGKEALPVIVEMEADRFQNLKYTESAFRTEAGAVLGEYNKSASNPLLKLEESLIGTAYVRHPYKHITLGFIEDIKAMPGLYEFSKEFFRRFYTPDNTFIFVSGDVTRDEVVPLVRKAYRGWKRKADLPDVPTEPEQTTSREDEVVWKGKTLPRLVLAWHVPAFNAKGVETAALDVLQELIFGETSTLYRRLKLDKQLVESLSGGFPYRRDATLFRVMATLRRAEDLPKVEAYVEDALAELRAGKVDFRRFEAVRSHLRYATLAGLDTPHAVMTHLARITAITGNPDDAGHILQRLGDVTPSDVIAVARKYFRRENRTKITLVPGSAAHSNEERKGGEHR